MTALQRLPLDRAAVRPGPGHRNVPGDGLGLTPPAWALPRRSRARSVAFTLLYLWLAFIATGPLWAESGLRLNGVIYLGDLPTLVADEQGFFQANGLDLRIEYDASGKESVRKLRAGETDFALTALAPFVLDRLNSPDAGPSELLIVANVSHSLGLIHVLARPDRGIETPGHLAGRSVSVMPGTDADFLLSLFLSYHGLNETDIDIHPLDTVTLSEPIETDAAVLWEPWASLSEQALGESLIRFSGDQVYTGRWVLLTRRQILDAHPEKVQAVLRAYADAIDFIAHNPSAVRALYVEHSGLPAERVPPHFDGLIYGLGLNWSLVMAMQHHVVWARGRGLVPEDASLDYLAHIAAGPLSAIQRALVLLPDHDRAQEAPR